MKNKQLFSVALIAMLAAGFTACSSDDGIADTQQSQQSATDVAKIKLNIHLPESVGSGSRAGGISTTTSSTTSGSENPSYADGDASEYNINNVWVYFYGESKNFLGKVQASTPTPTIVGSYSDNLTETAEVEITSDIFAANPTQIMVVVNDNGALNESGGKAFNQMIDLGAGNGTTTDLASSNIAKADGTSTNGRFMMTNTTYYDNSVTTNAKVNDLVNIEKNVYKEGQTPKDAAEVYVERVAAKVNIASSSPKSQNGTFNIIGWNLNVLNTKFYPVKKLDDGTNNFTTWVKENSTSWNTTTNTVKWNSTDDKRCFWAVDPNYGGTGAYASPTDASTTPKANYLSDFTLIKFSDVTKDVSDTLYCLENTFDNFNQTQDQTTTAIVLAQYMPNKLDGTTTEKANALASWGRYYGENYSKNALIKKLLNFNFSDDSLYAIRKKNAEGTYFWKQVGEIDDLTQYITITGSKEVSNSSDYKKGNTVIGVYGDYKLAYADADYEIVGVKMEGTSKKDSAAVTINKYVTTGLTAYYPDGYCYYPIRIRHFFENEVPLNADGINTVSQLGRYGVVRNNWYELTIESVSKAGEPIKVTPTTPSGGGDPTDPGITPDPTPDDELESKLKVKVNVHSWAKRGFKYNL